jgi:outer membrane protein assembly factor BamB
VDVRGNSVYVSTLGAERPGAARIYKLNARTGRVQHVWKHFSGLTGIAVARDGTIYVSQVFHGAPEGDPGPGFDPSTVGQITRIRDGKRTNAQVTMPTGLEIKNGKLYASTWSVASFLGINHAGKIEQIRQSAFH